MYSLVLALFLCNLSIRPFLERKAWYSGNSCAEPAKRKFWDLNTYFWSMTFLLRRKETCLSHSYFHFSKFSGAPLAEWRLWRHKTAEPLQISLFANKSTWELWKNQNKVLKCIFKSSWVLGFAKYWGLCKKKIPHGWGNTRTLKCTISKVPTSARGPPLGEADDKCIRTAGIFWNLTHFAFRRLRYSRYKTQVDRHIAR